MEELEGGLDSNREDDLGDQRKFDFFLKKHVITLHVT